METYQGYIESTDDALLIFEACRLGMLQRVTRRLSDEERQGIKSGSVFVWDEGESGIRRWTDGKRWSPSRVNGCFLMYTELESKTQVSSAGKSTSGKSRNSRKTNASSSSSQALGTPAPNGLVKKALSLFTAQNTKLHLVCYYSNEDLANAKLTAPSSDLLIGNLPIPRSLYPDVIPELIHTLHPATTAASRQQHQQQGAPAFTSLPLTPASSIYDGYSTGNNSRRQSHYDIAYATPTNANSTPVMVGSGYMVHESFAAPEPHYELSAPNTSTQTPFSSGFSLSPMLAGRLPSFPIGTARPSAQFAYVDG
ncbi:Gluconate transport-inducing protein [Dipsacomyces acuminosporus]|nr:Gluconate transport-inducing protein [Dipsacomyces acuminosporus]